MKISWYNSRDFEVESKMQKIDTMTKCRMEEFVGLFWDMPPVPGCKSVEVMLSGAINPSNRYAPSVLTLARYFNKPKYSLYSCEESFGNDKKECVTVSSKDDAVRMLKTYLFFDLGDVMVVAVDAATGDGNPIFITEQKNGWEKVHQSFRDMFFLEEPTKDEWSEVLEWEKKVTPFGR